MCHSKLDFEFGPNVNFIIGRNGSGKSAVLTALVIGLGGKANVTCRGNNIKNFIKTGQSFAVVEVHLRNQGPDAFKPMEYGSIIIVERKILKDGASTYKIKGKNGRIVSTKKEELLAILDQFNIQLDNPVSVLNQNTSKNFLTSKNPRDKYSFFLEATQLQQIKKSNADVAEKLQIAEDMLKQKEATLPELKEEVCDWKKKWQVIQCMQSQKVRLTDLKKEYAWALVIEIEKKCEDLHIEYNAQLDKSNEKQSELKLLEEKFQAVVQERQELEKELQAIMTKIKNRTRNKELLKQKLEETQKEIRSIKSQKHNDDLEVKSIESDIKNLNNQITEIVKAEPEDNSAEKERNTQIENFQAKITKLSHTKNSHNTELYQLTVSTSSYKETVNTLKHECRNLERQADSLQQQLQDIMGSRSNQLQQFGQCIPALVDCIEKGFAQGLFRKKPVGPVGAYISLHDPKWAVAIEACLGGLLEAFCCDNYDDANQLKNMIRNEVTHGRKPTVIVSSYQSRVHDVRAYKVDCQNYPNILDMLVIKNANIANTLIDQKSIESILLIENSSEARQIMTYRVPRNCNQCFTISGDQIFPVPSFRYYTSYKTYSKYLKGSIDEKIGELKIRQQEVSTSLTQKKHEITELQDFLNAKLNEKQKTEKIIATLNLEIGKINSELNTLMNFVETEPIDISSLQDEVKFLEDKLAHLHEKIESHEEALEKANNNRDGLKRDLIEDEKKGEEDYQNCKLIKTRTENLNEECASHENGKNTLEAKHKDLLKQVDLLRKEWESTQEKSESERNKTEKSIPRITTDRSRAIIYSEIAEIEKTLKREEVRKGNFEDICRRYFEAEKRYIRIKEEICDCSEILKKIKNGMELRQQSFVNLRTHLVARVKYHFSIALGTRDYQGTLNFNHQNAMLTFQVQPNKNVSQLCTDMRSLSGGERSFSTVSFILSLWGAMESPFRILDEYDVFMDMVNRRVSMDMMMDSAKQKLNHQFIFLTPLEMSSISASDIVKICRMPDPERRTEQQGS